MMTQNKVKKIEIQKNKLLLSDFVIKSMHIYNKKMVTLDLRKIIIIDFILNKRLTSLDKIKADLCLIIFPHPLG
jgi:hypothetical protein